MFWGEALVRVVASAAYIYAALTIAWRAGYRSPWVYAFVLVPGLNLVGLALLTFREWPVERRLRETQQQVARLTDGRVGTG